MHGALPAAYLEQWRAGTAFRSGPENPAIRAIATRQPVQVDDLREHQVYLRGDPLPVAAVEVAGVRTLVTVPMFKDNEPVGVITIYRREVRPFTDKQMELVKNFAAQAVIAIEKTRLLNELRQRTTDLTESLEQQTATSEVLKVISSSSGELEPVFEAILENATRICEARFGSLYLRDADGLRAVAATRDAPPGWVEARKREARFQPSPDGTLGRAVTTKQVVHVADMMELQSYRDGHPQIVEAVELGKFRTALGVPMLRDDELIGVIIILRQDVRPFTDKQIELVKNFAAQAVIAIENARLLNELRQSLEQQTATADVLRVISSSPGDLEPVFQAMLENATRICAAKFGNLWLCKHDGLQLVASHGVPAIYRQQLPYSQIIHPGPSLPIMRAINSRQTLHVADMRTDESYINREPVAVAGVEVGQVRTLIIVPMLKDQEAVGVFVIYRQEVRPFTDKQIALVENFATQAVIAIENTRLLNELRQRTDDLTESLEQQTATSEVLKVISSSPGELQSVFEAILANATRICEAELGMLWRTEGDGFRAAALHGVPPELAELRQREKVFHLDPEIPLGRIAQTHQLAHILNATTESAYLKGLEPFKEFVDIFGARTFVLVPMLKDDALAGVIAIYRKEVRPFTEKQIELVQNFAAQGVIAIENTRLLNELRQSLQQQTATADVLKVISRSTFDLQTVLDTLTKSAVQLCAADRGVILMQDEDVYRVRAIYGFSGEAEQYALEHPLRPSRGNITGRVALEGKAVHIPDVLADPEYTATGYQKAFGYRTNLGVPLLREGTTIGVFSLTRDKVNPFTDKQIELATTFADQAVIAIENARLLSELQQSLQQQTATADVLKVISRSTFDLQIVLNTLTESAARLCDADMASMHRQEGTKYRAIATYGGPPAHREATLGIPFEAGRGSVIGRTVLERKPIQVADVLADPEYSFQAVQQKIGFRTVLGVPLLREGHPIGAVVLMRKVVRPFTDKQIDLVTTFADQAGIAIENVRLFDEIQDKSRQLEEASQHKSQFLANMSHELRTPLNAILGYTELMADGAYGEPSEKMLGILKRLEANGKHLLGLINDVLDLSKIEAGQLVLELSDYCVQDIAQTVRSTLEPLASDKKLAFRLELALDLPPGHGDGRRLTQVLINLVGNAIKFTDAGEVAIKAEANNGSFHVSVRDTGPGISSADQARLFQEFQQADNAITKKKGGTGLGLAISKRIIEMHGGRIWVESQVGQGSTFAFTLPVVVERQVEPA